MPTISETEVDGWYSFVTDDLPPPSLPASAEIFLILERVKMQDPKYSTPVRLRRTEGSSPIYP
jgi:hypothetical protein